MKKNVLVYLVFYKGNLIACCRSAAKRRAYVKELVCECGYLVDKFFFDEQPLL